MARRKKGRNISGWLLVDKPAGRNATEIVALVKRLYNACKAGHAGTLDPMASGILPVALGEATKTVPFMMAARKQYSFTIRWGIATDSLDAYGRIIARHETLPTPDAIEAILPEFIGSTEQIPPRFSALKINGERAYDMARRGETVELAARPIMIEDLQYLGGTDTHAQFRVDCGKGTYIRSLAHDIAKKLGCIGHVSRLCRTKTGNFSLSDTKTLANLFDLGHSADDFAALDALLLPLQSVLDDILAVQVTVSQLTDLEHGRAIFLDENPLKEEMMSDSERCLALREDQAIALGFVKQGLFFPKRLFLQPK